MFKGTIKGLGVVALVATAAVGVWYIGSKVYEHYKAKDAEAETPEPAVAEPVVESVVEPVVEPTTPVTEAQPDAPETSEDPVQPVSPLNTEDAVESIVEPVVWTVPPTRMTERSETFRWVNQFISQVPLDAKTRDMDLVQILERYREETQRGAGMDPQRVATFIRSIYSKPDLADIPFIELYNNHYWFASFRLDEWFTRVQEQASTSVRQTLGFSEGAFKQQSINPANFNLVGLINNLRDICYIESCVTMSFAEFTTKVNSYVDGVQLSRGLAKRIRHSLNTLQDWYNECPFEIPLNVPNRDPATNDAIGLWGNALRKGELTKAGLTVAMEQYLGVQLTDNTWSKIEYWLDSTKQ